MNWTDGYVTDIGYTYGYYPELNPVRIRMAFANAGLACPQIGTACELGFGQGVSTNLHAAASTVRWHGNDFNPQQATFARALASASGAGAQLEQEAFADFCAREDLPQFDFIALHGIWSWVSAANRDIIADFVRRKLNPGGVLYISYNTQPGWAALMPLRDLLVQYTERFSTPQQGSAERIDAALAFAEQLFATNPVYAQANPFMGQRLEALKRQSRNYLAHEYFNRDWQPLSFADMSACWADAGLSFACSADFRDHLDAANLTPAQSAFTGNITDAGFRQSVRDFMVNQQFRRDYWVRGAQALTPPQRTYLLEQQAVVLLTAAEQVPLTVEHVASEITLNRLIYGPILDVLADCQPHTLAQIAAAVSVRNLTFGQVCESLLMLIGTGHAAPVQDPAVTQAAGNTSVALNRYLLEQAAAAGEVEHLASPVSGGGVAVDRVQQLFLQAALAQQHTPEEVAAWVWRQMSAQGKKLVKEGVRLELEADNLAELAQQAARFAATRLPVLKALQLL